MRELVITSPARNALSTAVLQGLTRELAAAGGEPVLLTGAGDTFSAGLDLAEVSQLDLDGARRLLGALEELVERLYVYPGPTVALVNGHAIAGGCVLALACDHRVAVADPKVRIGLNEVAIGLRFPVKTMAMVRARLASPVLERVVLGAGLHEPAVARELGLVDEVATDARAAAEARLALLAARPRAAYAAAKAALRGRAIPLDEARRREQEQEVLPSWASAETRAAAAKMLKR